MCQTVRMAARPGSGWKENFLRFININLSAHACRTGQCERSMQTKRTWISVLVREFCYKYLWTGNSPWSSANMFSCLEMHCIKQWHLEKHTTNQRFLHRMGFYHFFIYLFVLAEHWKVEWTSVNEHISQIKQASLITSTKYVKMHVWHPIVWWWQRQNISQNKI